MIYIFSKKKQQRISLVGLALLCCVAGIPVWALLYRRENLRAINKLTQGHFYFYACVKYTYNFIKCLLFLFLEPVTETVTREKYYLKRVKQEDSIPAPILKVIEAQTPSPSPPPEPSKPSLLVKLIPSVILKKVIQPILRPLQPILTRISANPSPPQAILVQAAPVIAQPQVVRLVHHQQQPLETTRVVSNHQLSPQPMMLTQVAPNLVQPSVQMATVMQSPPMSNNGFNPIMGQSVANTQFIHSTPPPPRQYLRHSPTVASRPLLADVAPQFVKQKSDPVYLPAKRPVKTNAAFQARLNVALKRNETLWEAKSNVNLKFKVKLIKLFIFYVLKKHRVRSSLKRGYYQNLAWFVLYLNNFDLLYL